MTEDYYNNPLDIFKDEDVKRYLGDIVANLQSAKMLSRERIQSFLETSLLSKFVTGPNIFGAFASFTDRATKRVLRSYVRELIQYLSLHPVCFNKEMSNCLIVSAIVINFTSNMIRNTTDHITWGVNTVKGIIKTFSFFEGIEEAEKVVEEKEKGYIWNLLCFPIALYLNLRFSPKVVIPSEGDIILKDLMNHGMESYDISELCKRKILLLNNQSIAEYTRDNVGEMIKYLEKNQENYPSILSVIEGIKTYNHLIVEME